MVGMLVPASVLGPALTSRTSQYGGAIDEVDLHHRFIRCKSKWPSALPAKATLPAPRPRERHRNALLHVSWKPTHTAGTHALPGALSFNRRRPAGQEAKRLSI